MSNGNHCKNHWKSNENHCKPLKEQWKPLQNHWISRKTTIKPLRKQWKPLQTIERGVKTLCKTNEKPIKSSQTKMGWSWKLLQNHWKSNKTIANHWKNNGNHCATIGKSMKSNFSMGGVHPRGVCPPHRKVTFHRFPNGCAMVCIRLKEKWKYCKSIENQRRPQ